MTKINGDLIPSASGIANLGVNGNAVGAYDISSISPFGHIHQLSGVFHNEVGNSGIFRFGRTRMEVSNDGGATFAALSTGGVDSVGILGGIALTGAINLASKASGFMALTDNGIAGTPIFFAVDNQGLSGFWRFPAQGFNGRVVNALTDTNGTEAQGVIQVAGVSGIIADLVGNVLSIAPGNTLPRSFSQTFGASSSWVATHNLNSSSVIIQTFDNTAARLLIEPDDIEITDANTVTVRWNQAQAGLIVIFAAF